MVLQFTGEGGTMAFSVERVIGAFAQTQLRMPEGTSGLRCSSLEWDGHRYRLVWFVEVTGELPARRWYISPDNRVAWSGEDILFSPWPAAPPLADVLGTLEAERGRQQCRPAGNTGEEDAFGGE
jgi:hypothetical protein